MDLKELHYIVTIANEGSISRAAEKLYMAQSSLSQFLQIYEAEFEYILGPQETILGRVAREEFQKLGQKPFARNVNFTALFAAAMAREGIALAFTYESCIVETESAVYLRIGEDGIFLELGLAYPVAEYRSKATKALGALFHETYGEH